jgi:hypothetical protein
LTVQLSSNNSNDSTKHQTIYKKPASKPDRQLTKYMPVDRFRVPLRLDDTYKEIGSVDFKRKDI